MSGVSGGREDGEQVCGSEGREQSLDWPEKDDEERDDEEEKK